MFSFQKVFDIPIVRELMACSSNLILIASLIEIHHFLMDLKWNSCQNGTAVSDYKSNSYCQLFDYTYTNPIVVYTSVVFKRFS